MTPFSLNHPLEGLFSKHGPILRSWGQDFSTRIPGHSWRSGPEAANHELRMNADFRGYGRKEASPPSVVGTVAPELAVRRARDHLCQGALKGPHWLWLGFLETEQHLFLKGNQLMG